MDTSSKREKKLINKDKETVIILCKILYIGTIFMLKVITIDQLKGYISK